MILKFSWDGQQDVNSAFYSLSFEQCAQFLKAKTTEFQAFTISMIKDGIIMPWETCFVEFKNSAIKKKYPWVKYYLHYVSMPNMNSIANFLTQMLKIEHGVSVPFMKESYKKVAGWIGQVNLIKDYDCLILTLPLV